MIAGITALTSAGMAAKNAKDAKETAMKNGRENQKQKNQDEAIFNRQYYQDMTERTEVQNMLRKLREQQAEQRGANEARAAVLGTTEEQNIASQDSLNKGYADSIAEMTRNASTLKDSYLKDYQNNLHTYYDRVRETNTNLSNMQKETSNQWSQAANNALQAAGSFAGIAAGAAGGAGGSGINYDLGPITQAPTTSENIAAAPSRSAQFNVAANAATSPVEKTVYQDLSNIAQRTQAAQAAQEAIKLQDNTWYNSAASKYQQQQNPWMIGWTK